MTHRDRVVGVDLDDEIRLLPRLLEVVDRHGRNGLQPRGSLGPHAVEVEDAGAEADGYRHVPGSWSQFVGNVGQG